MAKIETPEIFILNGFELAPWIEAGTLTYEENDLHGGDSGRTMDGTMHIGWIGTKQKWGGSLLRIPQVIAEEIFEALSPGWKTLRTINPHFGLSEKTFYCGSRKAAMDCLDEYGNPCWAGLSFSLIER